MRIFFAPLIIVTSAMPAMAQQGTGRVADSAVGQVGQRQSATNAKPTDRISNRIRNRVELRIRNRIDRFYNPQGDAASSFDTANDRSRINPDGRSR
jgi:hypothetical protein